MPRVAAARAEVRSESEMRDYYDPVRIFCARLPYAIDLTQDLRLEALEESQDGNARRPANHRLFYVACASVSTNPELRSDHLHAGINTMPLASSVQVCAEKRVKQRFEKTNRGEGGHGRINGLVIIGDPQEDRATGNDPETLWPCGEFCLPGVIKKLRPDTLVVTVRPDKRKGQVQTAGEMDTYYKAFIAGNHPSEPPLFHQPEKGWDEVLVRYDAIVPRNFNVLESPENYAVAVEAARYAIQGFRLRVV